MSSLTLYIPHFFHQKNSDIALANVELAKLLGKAKKVPQQSVTFEEQLKALWHWPNDHLPVAHLLYQHLGGSNQAPYLYCADPVYLQADFSGVFLTELHRAVSREESAAIQAVLNEFIESSGMMLHDLNSNHWFLSSNQPVEIANYSPSAVLGKNITTMDFESNASQQLLTEIQMLLHQHPVNEARQETGHAMINSLWIWGGGELPAPFSAQYDAVCSSNKVVTAIAHHLKVNTITAKGLNQMVASMGKAQNALIVLDDFLYGDHLGDQQHIKALTADWLLPIREVFSSSIKEVHLLLGDNYQLTLRKSDLWRFWRNSYARQQEN